MNIDWVALAKFLGTTPEVVQVRAAQRLIQEELTRLDEREAKLKAQYAVATATELERLIRNDVVPEHPSWEHVIEWEAIEDRRGKLKVILDQLCAVLHQRTSKKC